MRGIVVGTVFPIFAIIALGYLGRRRGIFNEDATGVLTGYVYYFSLPAMLFLKVSAVPLADLFNGNVLIAYGGALLSICLIIIVIGRRLRVEGKVLGMFILNSLFGNVGYMGVPFVTLAFGDQAAVGPTLALTIVVTVVVTITFGLVVMQSTETGGFSPGRVFKEILLKRFLKNPILLAISLAALCPVSAATFPEPLVRLLRLLADTAGPVALFALGIYLFRSPSAQRPDYPRRWKQIALLTVIKLMLVPLVTLLWFEAYPAGRVAVGVTVLQSAMPVAVTNFVLAQQHGVDPDITAGTVVVTTVLSVLTLSVFLIVLR